MYYMAWDKDAYIREGGLPLWNIWLTLKKLCDYKKQNILHLLIPSPTKKFNIIEVDKYMKHLEDEWDAERQKRCDGFSYVGFKFTQLPSNAKLWAYEVLKGYRKELDKKRAIEIKNVENTVVEDMFGFNGPML